MEYATQDGDPQAVRAVPQADPRPRRGVPQAARRRRAAAPRRRARLRRPRLPPAAEPTTKPTSCAASTARSATQELPHDEAFRLTLARVLVVAGVPVPAGDGRGRARSRRRSSDWELASRLSYFLWSSLPDAELRAAAAAGRLRDPDVLAAQARRMLSDDARPPAGHRVRLPVAARLRLRRARREERAALPDVRRPARRHVRGVDPLLHRPVPARRARC